MADHSHYRRQRLMQNRRQMDQARQKYEASLRTYDDKVAFIAHGFTLDLKTAVDIHAAENPHSEGAKYAKHILMGTGPALEALAQIAAERIHDPTHLHEHENAMEALVRHVKANYYEAWVQPVVKVLEHLGIRV